MKAFNNVLSGQRIAIERAFGILIRRWLILWSTMEYDLKTNALIPVVCALLQNICVDRWLLQGRYQGGLNSFDRQYDASAFDANIPSAAETAESDEEIMNVMRNAYMADLPRAAFNTENGRKNTIVRHIASCGQRYHSITDLDFTCKSN